MKIRKPLERWFEVPDDPDGAKIKIRHLLPGDLRRITNETYTHDIIYSGSKQVIKQTSDNRADREKTLQMRIVAWENVLDSDGSQLECTPENIIRASNEIEGFDALILEFASILSKNIGKEAEDQEKN